MSSQNFAKEIYTEPGLVDTLSNLIIRPTRFEYTQQDLEEDLIKINYNTKNEYFRFDVMLDNMRGLAIQCSWYKPLLLDEQGTYKPDLRPCVIYCHGNCGSRLDALEVGRVLEKGFTLFTFDFCGCGKSDGEYISLGYYEQDDLAAVVDYLESRSEEVSSIAIWGRSMGAVTAIMYAAKDSSISCIVCDSPFSSLKQLIDDLMAKHTQSDSCCITNLFKPDAVKLIRKNIIKRAMFDIDDVDTVKFARDCKVPTMLIHGESDDFVAPVHSKRVYDAFENSCVRSIVLGGHNDDRAPEVYERIIGFITHHSRKVRR